MAAGADTITFESAPISAYGFGVGLYNGTVNGVNALFICDDFFTDISGGQTWNANAGITDPVSPTVLFTGADVTLPFPISGTVTTQEDYNMIGYLADQIFADANDSLGNWGIDNFALWSLNDSAAYANAVSQGIGSNVESLLSAAYANRNTPSDLIVYTPDPPCAGQEFLSTTAPVPEPSGLSLMLIGGGILGLVRITKLRRAK